MGTNGKFANSIGSVSLIMGLTSMTIGCGSSDFAVSAPVPSALSQEATSPAIAPAMIAWPDDLPINKLLNGDVPTEAMAAAIGTGVANCMQLAGFTYFADPAPVRRASNEATFRAEHGFGFGVSRWVLPVVDGPSAAARNAQYYDGLSPDQQSAYDAALGVGLNDESGRPASGCRESAEMAIEQHLIRYDPTVTSAIDQVSQQILSSDEFLNAQHQWAMCMAAHGYNYSALGEPESQFVESAVNGTDASDHELQIATVDLRCRNQYVVPVQITLEEQAIEQLAQQFPQVATAASSG